MGHETKTVYKQQNVHQPTSIRTFTFKYQFEVLVRCFTFVPVFLFFVYPYSDIFLHGFQTHTRATGTHIIPAVLPPPTPQLPPAFFSSNVSQLNSLDIFSSCGSTSATLDVLDDLSSSEISGGADTSSLGHSVVLDALDGLDSLDDFTDTTPVAAKNESKSKLEAGGKYDLLDRLHPLEYAADPGGLSGEAPTPGVKRMDQLDSIDVLDSFPSVEGSMAPLKAGSIGGTGLHSRSNFTSTGYYVFFVFVC